MAKKQALKSGMLVIVHWNDIASYDSWITHDDSLDYPLVKAKSVGWVVNDDGEILRLASNIAEDTHNVLVIPKSVIIKVEKLDDGE
jgi:hypothetical protein